MIKKLHSLISLIRLDKPTGMMFVVLPCLWGALIASKFGAIDRNLFCALMAVVVLQRSALCAINDMWDYKYDRHVDRCKNRPLACGDINFKEACVLVGVLCIASLLIVIFFIHSVFLVIGGAGVMIGGLYPATKRFFKYPQLILGVCINWGLIVFSLTSYNIESLVPAIILFTGTIAWTIGYDTIYALQDASQDSNLKLHSTALLLRDYKYKRAVIVGLYGYFLISIFIIGAMLHSGMLFGGAMCALGGYIIIDAMTFDINTQQMAHFKKHGYIYGALITIAMYFLL